MRQGKSFLATSQSQGCHTSLKASLATLTSSLSSSSSSPTINSCFALVGSSGRHRPGNCFFFSGSTNTLSSSSAASSNPFLSERNKTDTTKHHKVPKETCVFSPQVEQEVEKKYVWTLRPALHHGTKGRLVFISAEVHNVTSFLHAAWLRDYCVTCVRLISARFLKHFKLES